jgi:hypothetical protein
MIVRHDDMGMIRVLDRGDSVRTDCTTQSLGVDKNDG